MEAIQLAQPLKSIKNDIIFLVCDFSHVLVEHCPMESNRIYHALASRVVPSQLVVWHEDPPNLLVGSWLVRFFAKERHQCLCIEYLRINKVVTVAFFQKKKKTYGISNAWYLKPVSYPPIKLAYRCNHHSVLYHISYQQF